MSSIKSIIGGIGEIGGGKRDKTLDIKNPSSDALSTEPNEIINSKELMSKLKGIAAEYDDALKKEANDYAKGATASDLFNDDLKSAAKENLDAEFSEKKAKAQAKKEGAVETLEAKKSTLTNDRERALTHLAARYQKKEDALSERLSKNQMTNSSIKPLAREALLSDRAREENSIQYTYDKRLSAVEGQIARKNADYESAMKNLDLTYAVRLEEEIARLEKKRDRLATEYEKEHKQEREASYLAYLEKEGAANAAYEAENGDYQGRKKENYTARYQYLVKALEGKSSKSVAAFLNENQSDLKQYLGLYYDRFIKEVS